MSTERQSQARTVRIEVRLSPAERDDIAAAADEGGEDIAAFLRRVALRRARRRKAKRERAVRKVTSEHGDKP